MKGRIAILLAAVAVGAGCNESNDVFLSIRGAAVPNATCGLEPDPEAFRSIGTYDPRNGAAFLLTPNVENRLSPTEDNNQEFFEDDSLFPEGNSLALIGFDVCYVREEEIAAFGSVSDDGFPVECEANGLPGEFIGAARTISPGGNISTSLDVASLAVLQNLFGEGFVPDDIATLEPAGNLVFASPQPSDAEPRDPNWGEFPSSGRAGIFVIATAVAERSNGDVLRSGPFEYRVVVEPGARDDFCGALNQVVCPDGSAGLSGQVPSDATCNLGSGFNVTCEDFTTCADGG